MTSPKFSVITVSFNQGEFIRDTIESVLAQNYPNFEHLIIDAGSTDNTLSILGEYPHLKWTSEPDRGQSHGLNKGFERATGDVIAWINSDDWYAPGTFAEVAKHIVDRPIVMGGCQVTDRVGNAIEDVPNIERSWFDTIKYWVFHSVPAQPGIFFRRSVFNDLGLSPESALDEGLNFTMDFDFWLRVQEKYPLGPRIPRLFAYMRNYETSKTGGGMASAYREMSRVYRRHSARRVPSEQIFSFVVPVTSESDPIEQIISEVSKQTISQTEIVFVPASNDRAVTKSVRERVLAMEGQVPDTTLRIAKPDSTSPGGRLEAINRGVQATRSQFAAVMKPDSRLKEDFVASCLKRFAQDNVGALVVNLTDKERHLLFSEQQGQILFNPGGPFNVTPTDCEFVVRKIAWLDCEGFSTQAQLGLSESYCFKRLLVLLTHKAWRISLVDSASQQRTDKDAHSSVQALRLYENSAIVDEISHDVRNNEFSVLRAKNGFAIVLSDETWAAARQIVDSMPTSWRRIAEEKTEGELRALVQKSPHFSPAYALLSEVLAGQGRLNEAGAQSQAWGEVYNQERQSPLFGA